MLTLQSRIYRVDLQANPDTLYVFGDNEARWGKGGQAAEMRDEPNAVGVATLKAPGVYWIEADAERQNAVIDADMAPAFIALRAGRHVVFPLDGIGSGLAMLEPNAPSTWVHLQNVIQLLKQVGKSQ